MLFNKIFWIKPVSWEYSCVEEYLIRFSKGKFLRYVLLLFVHPRNRLDPVFLLVMEWHERLVIVEHIH